MLEKFTVLIVFLGILSLPMAFKITSNVADGVPGFLNITTAPFVKIGSGYYIFENSQKKNWYDAYESCRRLDAELISFESLAELKLISQYLTDTHINKFIIIYWTAGTDLVKQDNHVWFSNGQPVSSDLWFPEEPNNTGKNEHCDELNVHREVTFGLNDKDCSVLNPYICKAQQPKTASFIIW